MKKKNLFLFIVMLVSMLLIESVNFATTEDNVAKIGETSYATLVEAIGAVKDGETITLLKDAKGGFDIGNSSGTTPKKFTLDMNGHSLDIIEPVGSPNTVTNGVRVLANSELTIKNGTINASSERVKMVIANYGTLTLENVIVNSGINTIYTINNRGNLTLKGNTNVESSKAGDNIAITNDPYDFIYENVNAILNIADKNVTVGNVLVELYGNSKNAGVPELNISAGTIENIKDDGKTAINVIGNITGGSYANPIDKKFLNSNNLVEGKVIDGKNKVYSYYASVEEAMKVLDDSAVIKSLESDEDKNQYTITLNYRYGGKEQKIIVEENEKILLPTATRKNYIFNGWSDGAKNYEGSAEIVVTRDITLLANWKMKSSSSTTVSSTFTDVEKDDWFYDAVEFVSKKGLFNGVTKNKFGVNVSMTRGMMVEVLYRFAGAKEVENIAFDDVDKDMYYAKAIAWAAKLEIVNGVGDNKFAPDRDITREELALIMSRYIKKMNIDTSNFTNEYKKYDDEEQISEYALEAVKEMQIIGLMEGKTENKFDPKKETLRVEVATLLMRFSKILSAV